MAGAQYTLDKGFKAAAAIGSAATGPDLATSYDYFVCVKKTATADTITPVTVATDVVIGVAQQRVQTADINSQVIDVRLLGISKIVVGTGPVAFGDQLRPDTAGKATVTTTAGNNTFGMAMSGGATGDLIDVLLTPGAQVGA